MKIKNASSHRTFFYKSRDINDNFEGLVLNQIYNVLAENKDIVNVLKLNKPFAVLVFNGKEYELDHIESIAIDHNSVTPLLSISTSKVYTTPTSMTMTDIVADYVGLFGEVLQSIDGDILY